MTLIRSGVPQVPVYANWGRWVANCCICPSAEKVEPVQSSVICEFCGSTLELVWPTEPVRTGVERLLMLRPDPSKRNWLPDESLHDLLAENVDHGVGPQEEGQVLEIIGDTITCDTLPRVPRRHQIGA